MLRPDWPGEPCYTAAPADDQRGSFLAAKKAFDAFARGGFGEGGTEVIDGANDAAAVVEVALAEAHCPRACNSIALF